MTLIDKSDAFVFGYSKLDVMFGRDDAGGGSAPYGEIAKPGVRVLQETITSIDPEARRVTTDAGTHDADVLVVALGADYDLDATPGLAEGGNEFYSVAGAERLAELLPSFSRGRAIVGVCGAPFKCPPAPSECALLLHDFLSTRGVRDACEISIVIPFGTPGAALARHLGGAGRRLRRARHRVRARAAGSPRSTRAVAVLDDGSEMPFDLFLGVPKHRAPDVVIASGMAEDGYVPVTRRRSRPGSRVSTRSATSRRSACRRPAFSPRARRGSSRRR